MPTKLKLNLDALEVASFETVETGGGRGTVHANSFWTEPGTGSASECNTYDESCLVTECDDKSRYSSCASVTFTIGGTGG